MGAVFCPKCGLVRAASGLKRHIDSRPCRSKRVVDMMQAEHQLVPVLALSFAKLLRWAGVPYERLPAITRGTEYRRSRASARKSSDQRLLPHVDFFAEAETNPLYEGLSDCLFVEEWVDILMRG
ncbi:unnamed protein product, partial [marine sediment metagenome]